MVSHRGPDGDGLAFFAKSSGNYLQTPENWSVGLGHKRLSILDLSSSGSQPMKYREPYWMVFNGEIYNYIELRTQLQKLGHFFQSTSDTEVVLASYAEWGVDCFKYFRGMWGIVIFDQQKDQIVLSRDRLGIKPLYLINHPDYLAVASEIKQFKVLPGFSFRMNREAISEWAQTGYEYYDQTFFKEVFPVRPGTYQVINLKDYRVGESVDYWFPQVKDVRYFSAQEAADQFRTKFEESVKFHLRSDVPVACALSGGLDSSVVALIMNKMGNGGLHTFSTFFENYKFNERPFIEEVLKTIQAIPHFNSPAHELMTEEVKNFIWHNDEPPVAFSPFASFMLAKSIHQQGIKVTMNGQGGDEILGGYWQNYLGYLRNELKDFNIVNAFGHLGGSLLSDGNPQLVSSALYYLGRIRGKTKSTIPWRMDIEKKSHSFLQKYFELSGAERRIFELRYLILPKLLKYDDRNTMAFSVEGRYPFLDHELIELCLGFQPDVLYKRGWTKMPIRLGFKDILPEKVQTRKSKWGYPVPQSDWLIQARSYFTTWLKNDTRPVWNVVSKEYTSGLFENIYRRRGRGDEHEIFVRIFFLDIWMELFQINN